MGGQGTATVSIDRARLNDLARRMGTTEDAAELFDLAEDHPSALDVRLDLVVVRLLDGPITQQKWKQALVDAKALGFDAPQLFFRADHKCQLEETSFEAKKDTEPEIYASCMQDSLDQQATLRELRYSETKDPALLTDAYELRAQQAQHLRALDVWGSLSDEPQFRDSYTNFVVQYSPSAVLANVDQPELEFVDAATQFVSALCDVAKSNEKARMETFTTEHTLRICIEVLSFLEAKRELHSAYSAQPEVLKVRKEFLSVLIDQLEAIPEGTGFESVQSNFLKYRYDVASVVRAKEFAERLIRDESPKKDAQLIESHRELVARLSQHGEAWEQGYYTEAGGDKSKFNNWLTELKRFKPHKCKSTDEKVCFPTPQTLNAVF